MKNRIPDGSCSLTEKSIAMKKIVSCMLILALFLSLSLCGGWDGRAMADPCDNRSLPLKEDEGAARFRKTDDSTRKISAEEGVLGLWIASVDVKDRLAELEPAMAAYLDSAPMSLTLELYEDGSYTLSRDISPVIPGVQTALYSYLGELCAKNGIPVASLRERFGTGPDEIVAQVMAHMDLQAFNTTEEGRWEEKDGQVIWNRGVGETRGSFTGDSLSFPTEEDGDILLRRSGPVGLWAAEGKLRDLLDDADGESAQAFAEMRVGLALDLRSDSSFRLSIDRSWTRAAMKVALLGYLGDDAAKNGLSVKEMEKSLGRSMEQIAEERLGEMDLSWLDRTVTGSYTESDGEIRLQAEEPEADGSWSGNSMTLKLEKLGELAFLQVSTEDILAKSEDAMDYAAFAAAEAEEPVVIEAYVQAWGDWGRSSLALYAQDAEGGYYVAELACPYGAEEELIPGRKIRVTGVKSQRGDGMEIVGASFTPLIGSCHFAPLDLSAPLEEGQLIRYQNQKVVFKGMTVDAYDDSGAAFAFEDAENRNGDLYFKASGGGRSWEFRVALAFGGREGEAYKAVQKLNVGDSVDLEGFLYWNDGAQPQITAVTVK